MLATQAAIVLVDAERAFEILQNMSQDINTPVRNLAQQVVDSRAPATAGIGDESLPYR